MMDESGGTPREGGKDGVKTQPWEKNKANSAVGSIAFSGDLSIKRLGHGNRSSESEPEPERTMFCPPGPAQPP